MRKGPSINMKVCQLMVKPYMTQNFSNIKRTKHSYARQTLLQTIALELTKSERFKRISGPSSNIMTRHQLKEQILRNKSLLLETHISYNKLKMQRKVLLALLVLDQKGRLKVIDPRAMMAFAVELQDLEKRQLRNAIQQKPPMFQDSTRIQPFTSSGHSIASKGHSDKHTSLEVYW
jgi:hypothetical protein